MEVKEINKEIERLESSSIPLDLDQEEGYYAIVDEVYVAAQNITGDELLARRQIDIDSEYLAALTIFTTHCMKNEDIAKEEAQQKVKH